MGTVGVGSSVWEQLELGALLWKQMEQEAINWNSGNKVQCMGIVGTWSSVWELLKHGAVYCIYSKFHSSFSLKFSKCFCTHRYGNESVFAG